MQIRNIFNLHILQNFDSGLVLVEIQEFSTNPVKM